MLIQNESGEYRRLVLTTSSLALAPVRYRGMLDNSRHFGRLPALYKEGGMKCCSLRVKFTVSSPTQHVPEVTVRSETEGAGIYDEIYTEYASGE